MKARLLLPCHGDEEKEEDYLWDEDHGEGLSESAINEYLVFGKLQLLWMRHKVEKVLQKTCCQGQNSTGKVFWEDPNPAG